MTNSSFQVLSVREHPELADDFIAYFQKRWARPESMMVYDDCIRSSLNAAHFLPQWYLLYEGEKIVGGCGVISNDFISRMDLYPWLCALYIEEDYRGRALGSLLIARAKSDTLRAGYNALYVATDHVGYYERYGFTPLAVGYHPWGDTSKIYCAVLK